MIAEIVILTALAGLFWMIRGGLWYEKINPLLPGWLSHKTVFAALTALTFAVGVGFSWWSLIAVTWVALAAVALGTGDLYGKMIMGHEWVKENGNGEEKWMIGSNAWLNAPLYSALLWLPFLVLGMALGNPLMVVVFVSSLVSLPFCGIVSRKLVPTEKRWKFIEGCYPALMMVTTIAAG